MIKKSINVGEHLTPFSTGKCQENMLIGSLNEDNIIGHVKGFIACHDPCLTVIDSHDYGLIGFNDKWIVPESQLTSIDQIYRVEEKLEADEPGGLIQIGRFFIGCEAKTNTTGATEAAAIVYMNVHLGGKAYDKISIKSDADAALLKMSVKNCLKSAVDGMSAFVARVKAVHHKLSTEDQLLLTMVICLDTHDLALKQRSSVLTVKYTFVPSQDGQQMVYWWMSPEKITPQLHTVQLSCFEVYHTFGVLPVLQDSCCQKAGISHNPQEPVEHPSKIKRGRLAVPTTSHVNHLVGNDSMDQIEGAAMAIEVDSISLGPPPPKSAATF
ncbi:hypothetical protein EMCRGX_G026017 [Ephydatia muelleri]